MKRIVGLDIGGVNTKIADLRIEQNQIVQEQIRWRYFPLWKQNSQTLTHLLAEMVGDSSTPITAVGVTITAELSDAYSTKAEGIAEILDAVEEAFPSPLIGVLTNANKLVSPQEARKRPLDVAAANWAATGWLVAQRIPAALVVDTGSTSTSIIPIYGGKVVAQGSTDLEKLQVGELIYTGVLRTTLPSIVHQVPVNKHMTKVSAEWFAQSGDVHLVLGHISPDQYSVDTPDGRGVTLQEARARIARLVCADLSMLAPEEIDKIAMFIYKAQIQQIQEGIHDVLATLKPHIARDTLLRELTFVITGLGGKFLGYLAAQASGARKIILLEKLLNPQIAQCTPAYGVAVRMLSKK